MAVTIEQELMDLLKTKYNITHNPNNIPARSLYIGLIGGDAELVSQKLLQIKYEVAIVFRHANTNYLDIIKDIFVTLRDARDNFSLYLNEISFNKDNEFIEIDVTFTELI
jgi:hypothetical protein